MCPGEGQEHRNYVDFISGRERKKKERAAETHKGSKRKPERHWKENKQCTNSTFSFSCCCGRGGVLRAEVCFLHVNPEALEVDCS